VGSSFSTSADERRDQVRERRVARRGELLAAAIDVIRRDGAGATMEAMAVAGGISKPILYRHFNDREGLVAAIAELAYAEVIAVLDRKLGEARQLGTRAGVRATIDAFFDYIEREPELYRFVVDQDVHLLQPATIEFTDVMSKHVAGVLQGSFEELGRDTSGVQVWGRAIVGMVCSTAEWWLHRPTMPRSEIVDQLTDLAWLGIAGGGIVAREAARETEHETARDVTGSTAMFVYGTLMPGRLRWRHLEPFVVAHRRAAVAGAVYDSGRGWPVATLDDPAAPASVPGILVQLDPARLGAALALIDEVEDTATDELRRIAVTTLDGEPAWAYHFTRPVAGLTAIEAWEHVDPADER